MGPFVARSTWRGRVAVLGAVALALTGFVLTRNTGAGAHEVVTPYPMTCSMVGLSPTFTTTHTPEAGAIPGQPVTLHVRMATPATGHAMPTQQVTFSMPKPALLSQVTGVTFKTGTGNFAGSATVAADGTQHFTFTGNAASNAISLPDFDISGVTSASAMPGDRISWIGPSQILLDNGSTDTCRPASGAAIQYAPTVVLDPGAGCTTTTEEHGHGDHGHGGDHGGSCPTTTQTTTPTTRPTTATTRPTTQTSPTTRPTTQTTRPTTQTTVSTPTHSTVGPTTTMNPGGGLWALIWGLICFIFRIC